MGNKRNCLSRHDKKITDSTEKNERLQKKMREERERLSHKINVEVELHERYVEVHENDEEMRNVEELVNKNIESGNAQENIDIDLTGESIVSSI